MVESTISNSSKIKESSVYDCHIVGFEVQYLILTSYNLDNSYKEMASKF
jgi:hypothetical protein